MKTQGESPTLTMPNPDRVAEVAQQVVGELSAGMGGVMLQLGVELGLFAALEDGNPVTAQSLAEKANCYPRYVAEWLNCMAAGGYLTYEPETRTYLMTPEVAMVLANTTSPAYLAAGFSVLQSMWADKDVLKKAFRSGDGIPWHTHHHSLFFGTEAFYRAGYRMHLVNDWIPAITGLQEKLTEGALVADVGCGHGASTLLMGQAFPNSTFHGIDYHRESILVARDRAFELGLENVFFLDKSAAHLQQLYDMICFMDAFHDLGDPAQAAREAFQHLHPGGVLMLVEPRAGDAPEENFHPLGRMFYAASTALCVPHANAEKGQCCLGAQAGPSRITKILREVGFTEVGIAAQTDVNHIYQAFKPC